MLPLDNRGITILKEEVDWEMGIREKPIEGPLIKAYCLKNSSSLEVTVLNLGGIIASIKTPDKNGKMDDIVLGFDTPNDYLTKNDPYFGAIA